jgi:hypothetical protein
MAFAYSVGSDPVGYTAHDNVLPNPFNYIGHANARVRVTGS